MKTLKSKFGLFSLMAIFATSIFLTSCSEELASDDQAIDEIETSTENLADDFDSQAFILPFGYDELSEEEQDKYIESLTPEQIAELIESSRILDYFDHLGKYDELAANSKKGDIYNQNTLTSNLSAAEVETYASASLESRWPSWPDFSCGNWYNVGQPKFICVWYWGYVCREYRCKQKQKKVCNNRPDKTQYVPSWSCY